MEMNYKLLISNINPNQQLVTLIDFGHDVHEYVGGGYHNDFDGVLENKSVGDMIQVTETRTYEGPHPDQGTFTSIFTYEDGGVTRPLSMICGGFLAGR